MFQMQIHGHASEQPDGNIKSQLISRSLSYGAVAALVTIQVLRTGLDLLLAAKDMFMPL
jgi:hypothetical protein